jgi:hypothetical protein
LLTVVEFVRRRPFAVVGVAALVGLLVAGILYSDPPTSDDRDRPRPPPVKDLITPSATALSPSPGPSPTRGPTTPAPRPTRPVPTHSASVSPGPLNPTDLLVVPQP